MGTFYYIAPELLTSAIRADIRSDIYSLGVVFYEMLAGRRPFEAEDMADLASQHLQAAPPDLKELAPHLPDERGATRAADDRERSFAPPAIAGRFDRRTAAVGDRDVFGTNDDKLVHPANAH